MRSIHHPAGDRLHGPVSRRALLGGATAVAAAQSGQVDLACVYPGLSGQTVNGFTLRSLPTFGYRAITLPCQAPGAFEVEGQQVGNAAAGDPALRRAMATGVNRQQMIDDSLMGHGTVALDIFDSFDWGIKADTASLVDGDAAGAQRILEDAGWRAGSDGIRAEDDQRASFQLLYPPNDSGRQAIAEAFSAQMAPLGIEVEPTSGDFTWQVDHNRSNAVVLGGGRLNPYHEYTMLRSSSGHSRGWSNISCYANPTVDGHLDEALAAVEARLGDPMVVAVGESGLDYFRTADPGRQAQKESFRAHIEMAARAGLPLQIHDREAHEDTLAILDECATPDQRIVFHCYSGDAAMAQRLAERGWYASFAGPITYPANSDLRDALAALPRQLVLVETDAPYLTPIPWRGCPNASYVMAHTVRFIAQLWDVTEETACDQLRANTEAVYGSWW